MTPLAPRRPRLAAAGGLLLAGLTAAVAAGAFTWLDQFAVSHLMPWLEPRHHGAVTVGPDREKVTDFKATVAVTNGLIVRLGSRRVVRVKVV